MSTRTPAAPITPGFAWALPEVATVEPKAKKSPVSNPLLERASPRMNNGGQRFGGTNGFSAATATRLPFSPMDNKNSLRQRRKPSSTFLPPKSSLTEGSYALDENLQTNHKETSNTPTATVGGGRGVGLWSDGDVAASSSAAAVDSWESWVLVYGFTSKAQYDEVLRRFDAFGRVVTQRGTGTNNNWVALHYESNLEAEKALCQQTCVLNDGSVVGVSRMDQKMSQSLDWGATITTPAAAGSTTGSATVNKSGLDESDVLLQEQEASYGSGKRGSVCEKFLSLIFGWNDPMQL